MDRIELLAILIFLDLAEHHVRNLIAGVRPDIDDLVVAFAVCDNASAILLVDLLDLLVGILQFGLFPLWNDHVLDANRDTRPSRFPEPELFQFIQRGNRNSGTSDLVAAPNDIAKLLLARCLVEETKFFRPNLVENNAPSSCLEYVGVGISKVSLPSPVRVLK